MSEYINQELVPAERGATCRDCEGPAVWCDLANNKPDGSGLFYCGRVGSLGVCLFTATLILNPDMLDNDE